MKYMHAIILSAVFVSGCTASSPAELRAKENARAIGQSLSSIQGDIPTDYRVTRGLWIWNYRGTTLLILNDHFKSKTGFDLVFNRKHDALCVEEEYSVIAFSRAGIPVRGPSDQLYSINPPEKDLSCRDRFGLESKKDY